MSEVEIDMTSLNNDSIKQELHVSEMEYFF